ncbi:hypothetical protein TcG_03436 [Trypanosoma cruzi]|nr:hypothetical protein TcBrA4_0089740 [Trypanosoma cruzi]RNF20810.1 hypothetical protein TcG_03436 [Trypanosoma cruzi]
MGLRYVFFMDHRRKSSLKGCYRKLKGHRYYSCLFLKLCTFVGICYALGGMPLACFFVVVALHEVPRPIDPADPSTAYIVGQPPLVDTRANEKSGVKMEPWAHLSQEGSPAASY